MILSRLFCVIVLLGALPLCGFGQKIPVAPSLMLNVGGEEANAYGSVVKLDSQGNSYVIGGFSAKTNNVDFDPSPDIFTLGVIASGFVAKYSAAGTLVWAKSFSGTGNWLDLDRNGNITVIGERPPKVPHNNANGYSDAFILHLDNDGNVLWEKLVESGSKNIPIDPDRVLVYEDAQTGHKVSSDDAGNLIAAFRFGGSPDVEGVVTAKGTYDGLVVKYDPDGNVIWKFNLGSTGLSNNSAIETLVDSKNDIIVAGYTDGMVNYNPLGTPVNVNANHTLFIAKYSPAGILQWIKTINVNANKNNVKLALDSQDNIYINGSFSSQVDFGVAPTLVVKGTQDMFIAKYSSAGNLLYHKSINGTNATVLNTGMTTGPDNSLYLTGNFFGNVDFDHSSSLAERNANESVNMFLAKYDENGNYKWAFRIPDLAGGTGTSINLNYVNKLSQVGVQDVTVNVSDEIVVTGAFITTVNFNGTGCGVNSMTANNVNPPFRGLRDMFIIRYSPTNEIPIANNTATAPAVSEICPDTDPGVIIGSVPVGSNYTYQWQQSLDNMTFKDIAGAVSKDFQPTVLSATTYYRRKIITSECAALNASNVITLTLLTAASKNTITAPSMLNFCNSGDPGIIRGSPVKATGHVDYQWQQSTDSVNFINIGGATSIEYDPPPLTVTTYFRRLITSAPCNMGTPSNIVKMMINATPIPTVSAEQTVCIGNSVTLTATGGTQYSWSPAAGLSATDIASPTAKPTASTSYRVTVFNGSCSAVLSVKVVVIDKPILNAGVDTAIMKGDKIMLGAQISDVEGATYTWTPATYLDDPSLARPTASPTEDVTYRLTVKSPNGCFTVTDEVSIFVQEKLMVPNAFTPNGDGINDKLLISGLDSYRYSKLTIYNRTGQLIFKSLAYPKPWDGTHNGKALPTGTYYYVIELDNRKRLSGYIFLIR